MYFNERIQGAGEFHTSPDGDESTRIKNSDSDEMPQLDTSADSSWCADDDTSLSSFSSTASVSQRDADFPRALFPSYWEKSGGRGRTQRLRSLLDDSTASFESSQSTNEVLSPSCSYEEIIHESTIRKTEIIPRSRRRIFGQCVLSGSVPLLLALAEPREIRKTKSTSDLGVKKGCLRSPCREEQNKRLSDVSVTFSPKVDVLIFETPTLQWAAKGWSKWFT